VVELHRRGLFAWGEWVAALAVEIAARPSRPDEDPATAYHRQWLAALEALLATKGVATPAAIDERAEAWRRAYLATPHGEPVLLERAACPPVDDHAHHDHHDHGPVPRPIAVSPARG
jgi:nitrile hydratase accessory protein